MYRWVQHGSGGKKKPGRCLLSLVKGAFFEKGEGEREMDGEMFFPDQR